MNLIMIRRKNYKKLYHFLINEDYECCYEINNGFEKVGTIEVPEEILDAEGSKIKIEHKDYSIIEVNKENINNTDYLMLITEKKRKYILCKFGENINYYIDKSVVDKLLEFIEEGE